MPRRVPLAKQWAPESQVPKASISSWAALGVGARLADDPVRCGQVKEVHVV